MGAHSELRQQRRRWNYSGCILLARSEIRLGGTLTLRLHILPSGMRRPGEETGWTIFCKHILNRPGRPGGSSGRPVEDIGRFALDYTFGLNLLSWR